MLITTKELYKLLKERINDANLPFVIAIDGRSASGKTTFANILNKELKIPVIHTDDFFKPKSHEGKILITEFDGNFDIERFKNEVINGIASQNDFEIGIFNCFKNEIEKRILVPKSNCYIIEGAYSLNPNLGNYADFKIFFNINSTLQKERIVKRNGIELYKVFQNIWIPAEERYFNHYHIKELCNYVVEEREL